MNIPQEIKKISSQLKKSGFEAYLVGGCLRDLILSEVEGQLSKPKDWDIATNAKPEEIQKIFPDNVYENQFGTVGVKVETEDETLKVVEITTLRKEGKYTDKRHPDAITFAKTIKEDLSRRDFTINAIALKLDAATLNENLVDPFDGQTDLKKKIIRAVGNPEERFQEDALRLMRAVRFSAQLGFSIEFKTGQAVKNNSGLLEFIAKERIRVELEKLLMAKKAAEGVKEMEKLGLLRYVIPELREGIGVTQNKHHIYTVFEHNFRSLDYAAENNFPLDVRIASLLHDVGKPKAKEGDGPDCTFYGHQIVGARMTARILDRLRFAKKDLEKISLLVREHMFVYDPETVSLAGVRRLLRRVGAENIEDLLKLREADRIGSGVPKAQPYRLRYLKAMIEKVRKDPVSPKMLKINGNDVMTELKIEPGPKIGKILDILLEEILDDPKLNIKTKLTKRVEELNKLTERELDALAEKAKQKAEDVQKRIDEEIKKKYFVK